MPAWVIAWVLPLAVSIIKTYGIPALEAQFPKLAPLLEELLKVINGKSPSAPLVTTGTHYENACQGLGCPSDLIKE